jgi:hypothetical protein
MGEISRGLRQIQARDNLAREVRKRSERLKQFSRYRNPADTAPTTDSIAYSEGDVMSAEAGGGGASRIPNVLAEDTWDLFRVLLR